MADFEALNPDTPATVEAVAVAVMRLRAYGEADIAELISRGRLREIFPFRPRPVPMPPDKMAASELVEASARPLSDAEYAALVQGSMRGGLDKEAREREMATGAKMLEESLAESREDIDLTLGQRLKAHARRFLGI